MSVLKKAEPLKCLALRARVGTIGYTPAYYMYIRYTYFNVHLYAHAYVYMPLPILSHAVSDRATHRERHPGYSDSSITEGGSVVIATQKHLHLQVQVHIHIHARIHTYVP